MAGLDNINQGELGDILRRLRALETQAGLNGSSIGELGLRVHSGGVITIENGGLNVTGTATITGTLQADGTIAFTGTLTQSGPSTFTGDTKLNGPTRINGTTDIAGSTTVTGDFTVNGPMKTTGTLSVKGTSTLESDLNVIGNGKIVAGQTTIRPSGTINFGPTFTISPGDSFGPAGISDGFAKYTLTPGGGTYFHQFQGGIYVNGRINGMDLILSDLPTTSQPANLYVGSDGVVKRSTA